MRWWQSKSKQEPQLFGHISNRKDVVPGCGPNCGVKCGVQCVVKQVSILRHHSHKILADKHEVNPSGTPKCQCVRVHWIPVLIEKPGGGVEESGQECPRYVSQICGKFHKNGVQFYSSIHPDVQRALTRPQDYFFGSVAENSTGVWIWGGVFLAFFQNSVGWGLIWGPAFWIFENRQGGLYIFGGG